MSGRLIALDGLDGSGKETQTKLILGLLEAQSIPYRYLSFPTYDDTWSSLVKLYLGGGFGSSPEDVGPYAASTFFACDRYCSYMLDWKRDYESGSVIVCNRYVTGNAVHQLSKLCRDEWDGFLDWLSDYEYNKLGLPAPDTVIYLCVPPETAKKHVLLRSEQTGRTMDIHEKSVSHLENSYHAAVYAAKRLGWHTIDCADGDDMRTISDIHGDIAAILKNGGYIK